jgi:hypothetical protein
MIELTEGSFQSYLLSSVRNAIKSSIITPLPFDVHLSKFRKKQQKRGYPGSGLPWKWFSKD